MIIPWVAFLTLNQTSLKDGWQDLNLPTVAQQPITLPGDGQVKPGPDASSPDSVKVVQVLNLAQRESKLQIAFKDIKASLVVDLSNVSSAGTFVAPLTNDLESLQSWAKISNEQVKSVSGAYLVISSPLDSRFAQHVPGDDQFFQWLDNLLTRDSDAARKLFHGGIDISTLTDDDRTFFAGISGPLQKGSQGSLNLSLGIFPRPLHKGNDVSQQALNLVVVKGMMYNPVLFAPYSKTQRSPLIFQPDGDLYFGGGKVLSLTSLASMASTTFGIQISVDPRVGNDLVFIKGAFTRARIISALQTLLYPSSLILVHSPMDDARLRVLKRKVISNLLAQMDSSDPKVSYLSELLTNPGRVDSSLLAQFGFSATTISQTDSMGTALMIRFTSAPDTPISFMPDGTVIRGSNTFIQASYGP